MNTAPPPRPCTWCGGPHTDLQCDRVKALDFDAAGRVTHVEFVTVLDLLSTNQALKPSEPAPAKNTTGPAWRPPPPETPLPADEQWSPNFRPSAGTSISVGTGLTGDDNSSR